MRHFYRMRGWNGGQLFTIRHVLLFGQSAMSTYKWERCSEMYLTRWQGNRLKCSQPNKRVVFRYNQWLDSEDVCVRKWEGIRKREIFRPPNSKILCSKALVWTTDALALSRIKFYSTAGGEGGCRVSEVRVSNTFPMPDHKGLKLQ